ncbi:hypothetical protein MF672_048940 [Actinomadura sp. ATCC 31491]|uniref:Terpene synthase n=1 Tax=Actinomadura luzonensis TaxID=2805427 RepID=A0ABT0GAQ1_9ACTN|nr:hypothetical protein [Actinomadura luzonensis]MCK2221682.1 hypothetical protein [Actinomadura luzonensis]
MPSQPSANPTPDPPAPAHQRSRAWAQEQGLLETWDETRFESLALSSKAGHCHPGANAEELELAADWYVWAAWLDDHFFGTYRGERRQAGRFLDRLARLVPEEADERPPSPSGPGERALAELWARTARLDEARYPTSGAWRRRFADSTRSLVRGRLRLLDGLAAGRAPNPLEYVAAWRSCGGAAWAAVLVERVGGAELPEAVVEARAVRAVQDAFADGVHLLGDLRGHAAGEPAWGPGWNAVAVFERFLRCDARTAAERVDRLRLSRLRRFEHAALAGIPLLAEAARLGTGERDRLCRYVAALRDWQTGHATWHPTPPPDASAHRWRPTRARVTGGPASGDPASGGPASGGPASGGPASGGPASGGPASGGPASGGPASGGPRRATPHRASGRRVAGRMASGHRASGRRVAGRMASGHRASGRRMAGHWTSGGNSSSGRLSRGRRTSGHSTGGDLTGGPLTSSHLTGSHLASGHRASGQWAGGRWGSIRRGIRSGCRISRCPGPSG